MEIVKSATEQRMYEIRNFDDLIYMGTYTDCMRQLKSIKIAHICERNGV